MCTIQSEPDHRFRHHHQYRQSCIPLLIHESQLPESAIVRFGPLGPIEGGYCLADLSSRPSCLITCASSSLE